MPPNKEQEDLYRKAMDEAKTELESIDTKMEEEIQKTRERLAKLQESKKYYRQIYEGIAKLLGEEVQLNETEEEDNSKKKEKLSQNSTSPPLNQTN